MLPPSWMRFADRAAAGRQLARELAGYAGREDVVVLALPRGGVPVAVEVARALGAPLDVFQVRKLGVPGQEDLAMGAIASGGVRVLNEEVLREFGISDETVARAAAAASAELARRERLYRGERPAPSLAGVTAILVDDGLATGSTMRAAALAVRRQGARRVVVAVPVASLEACASLRGDADEIVCASTPEPFLSVGAWYRDFGQLGDEEVRELLARARAERSSREGR